MRRKFFLKGCRCMLPPERHAGKGNSFISAKEQDIVWGKFSNCLFGHSFYNRGNMNDNPLTTVAHGTAMEYRRRICAAMNFIGENLSRELSLVEIAGSAAFSMYHFHRIFKAVVGETVGEFTRRLRLEMSANKLLLEKDAAITDIALQCGFSSSQNFAKTFRQAFGQTPSAYRNSKNYHKFSKGENAISLQAGYDPLRINFVTQQFQRTGGTTMHAEVKEMPEYHVAYVRKLGPYGKDTCEQAFNELAQWAGPAGHLATGVILSIYWDNPEVTPPAKCRTDVCVGVAKGTLTTGQIATQLVGGGPYAVCRFELGVEEFQQAWEQAFAWLVACGYECADSPCYELYHNNAEEHAQGKWIIDICIPLKKD